MFLELLPLPLIHALSGSPVYLYIRQHCICTATRSAPLGGSAPICAGADRDRTEVAEAEARARAFLTRCNGFFFRLDCSVLRVIE